MADWYVSSAAYAGYAAFQTSHAYNVGDIVVPTAPTVRAKWAFRCTTAGTSSTEPTWATANNGTNTTGTATFTNVTGQSTFFWTAAAGDLATLLHTNNRVAGGDRVFLSSDHTETQTNAAENFAGGTSGSASFNVIQYISVSRAGSTPPVAADVTSGASVGSNTTMNFNTSSPCYHKGLTYTTSSVSSFAMGITSSTDLQTQYFKDCTLALSGNSVSPNFFNTQAGAKVVLDNTKLSLGNVGQLVYSGQNPLDLTWVNTASPFPGSTPTTLFSPGGGIASVLLATIRGVDLSAITGTLVHSSSGCCKYLFDSCKIAASVTRYSSASPAGCTDEMEVVNCYDGTNIISERYTPAGILTTETTITLSSGAADDVGRFSHKMVSSANCDKFANTFDSFWMDVENTTTGSSKTATVEIISSTALNNDEIALELQYEGTSSSSVASFGTSSITTPLTTAAAVATSTATWNSSPSTPQKQKLQVTFTPQHAGRVRGRVRLGKASATVYVNPQITIT